MTSSLLPPSPVAFSSHASINASLIFPLPISSTSSLPATFFLSSIPHPSSSQNTGVGGCLVDSVKFS